MALNFSGHDTFHCRQFWLKKGYDFINQGKCFPDADAPIALGVGKNMVAGIRHWMRAFGMASTDDQLTDIAKKLLADNGWDPFLEDQGSLWLLHFLLIQSDYASIYKIVFSELAQQRPEFTEDHFIDYVNNNKEGEYNQNTLKRDFNVFYRNYFGRLNEADIEDSFTGILTELHLLKEKEKPEINSKGKLQGRSYWLLEREKRDHLPSHILLFAILSNQDYGNSISFENLYRDAVGPGCVFLLSREGLTIALEKLEKDFEYIVFSNEAGIRELQFRQKPEPQTILEEYYAS